MVFGLIILVFKINATFREERTAEESPREEKTAELITVIWPKIAVFKFSGPIAAINFTVFFKCFFIRLLFFAMTGFMRSVRIRKDTMFFSDGQEKSENDHEWSGNDGLPAHMIFKNRSCLQNFLSFISNLAI